MEEIYDRKLLWRCIEGMKKYFSKTETGETAQEYLVPSWKCTCSFFKGRVEHIERIPKENFSPDLATPTNRTALNLPLQLYICVLISCHLVEHQNWFRCWANAPSYTSVPVYHVLSLGKTNLVLIAICQHMLVTSGRASGLKRQSTS